VTQIDRRADRDFILRVFLLHEQCSILSFVHASRATPNTDDILRLFFIDTCVCLTFNKIRPTRVHKHRWVETDRVDHHHHACLFSRFGARVRFHRDTSGSDKFFSLTTLTFDATGEKFLTLASDIFFFFCLPTIELPLSLQLSKTREQFYALGRCPPCKLFPECNAFVSCNQVKTDYCAIFNWISFNINDQCDVTVFT